MKNSKPLGRKAYGSIPHLSDSRKGPTSTIGIGPSKNGVHIGQERICTEKVRDRHDRIIVTEKYDGSNVAVAKIDGVIVPLTRSGYSAGSSPHKQHHMFEEWVSERRSLFSDICQEGMVIHAEWLAQAHGTLYRIQTDPFVVFDVTLNKERLAWDDAVAVVSNSDINIARVISDGASCSVQEADKLLSANPCTKITAIGDIEGAVWRVERRGKFDFMAKWVRPGKVDGKYFDDDENNLIWNITKRVS